MNHSCQEWLSITFYGSWENEGKDRDKISLALVGKKKEWRKCKSISEQKGPMECRVCRGKI